MASYQHSNIYLCASQTEWKPGDVMQLQKRPALLFFEMWGGNWSAQLNKSHLDLGYTVVSSRGHCILSNG